MNTKPLSAEDAACLLIDSEELDEKIDPIRDGRHKVIECVTEAEAYEASALAAQNAYALQDEPEEAFAAGYFAALRAIGAIKG
jgi:hypothetical protein